MDPAAQSDPARGTARRFKFASCLGRGGFGEVYRASMTDRGGVTTEVAVKILHEEVDPRSQSVQRLRDEAHTLAALRHPAILKVLDLVSFHGRVALVTEFIDGQDLSGIYRDAREGAPPAPPRALVDLIGQVASALAAAHDTPGPEGRPLGLVHRDIKPHNVRIGRHGEAKLLDFGIARAEGLQRSARTDTDAVVGSWQFMAPEAFDGNQGPPADVFSLGSVLFEGLSGERLYEGWSLRELHTLSVQPAVMQERLSERLRRIPVGVDARLRALTARMVSATPAERPSAAEVSAMCEDLADHLDGPSLRKWCRERSWPAPEGRRGEFDGLEVIEGQPAPLAPAGPPAAPRPSPAAGATSAETLGRSSTTSTGVVAMAASGMLGIVLSAAAVIALGLVVGLGVWAWPSPPPPAVAVVEPAVPAPAPERPAPLEAIEAPPAAEAPVEPAPTAQVSLHPKTKAAVRLVGPGGTRVPPADDLEPGTWKVEADFGDGWATRATVRLSAGDHRVIWCKTLTRTCE